ncbi:MAG: sulfite exporter TauE/SafE family protein [Anaerolineae bacterium]
MLEFQTLVVVLLIVFAAVFGQSIAGFGIALIAMPLLVPTVGIEISRPLVALIGGVNSILFLLNYRDSIDLKVIAPLAVTSVIATPLGEVLINVAPERAVTGALGVFIIAYSIYGLASPHIPEIRKAIWAYIAGLVSGILTGAYNTGGPPLVIYATACRWPPAEFKGNLQAIGMAKAIMVLITHGVSGNFTAPVMSTFGLALPVLGVATLIGFYIGDRINADVFQKIVLVLLLVLGIRLLV